MVRRVQARLCGVESRGSHGLGKRLYCTNHLYDLIFVPNFRAKEEHYRLGAIMG